MIDIGALSYEELRAIEELRKRVTIDPDLAEDFTLFYRFLKARDFDVDKAEKMLKKHINWRRANQVSTILKDFKPKEFFVKFIQPSILGLGKGGDLVVYLSFGTLEGRDILKCCQINEYMRQWIWSTEVVCSKIIHLMKKFQEKRRAIQICVIINFDGLTIRNATNMSSIEQCSRLLNIMQDNYPEALNSLYAINTPAYYVFGFSILKAMMSNAMLEKVHIFGHDGWKEKILEMIDADALPAFLGGNRTDPDGDIFCKSFVRHGGRFPQCYYLSNDDRDFKDKTMVTKIAVSKLTKKEIYIEVKEDGSVIHWEFFLRNKDIGFGLFREKTEEELIEVLPVQRYETVDGVEKGSYKAKYAGKYIIMFDNSYSWLSSKEIEYCIRVLKSEL